MTKFLNISTDNTLGGSSASDDVVSSQKAVKDYVDSQTGTAPAFANITGSPTDNTALANALNDKYDASNPSGFTSNIGTVTSVNSTSPDSSGNVTLTIPTINSSNNYVPYRSGASAFSNSTLMYNSNAMAFTGRLHIGSSSPASYYSKGRFTIYDNTPSQQVSSMALLNYGGGGGCGVAIDMYNTSANGGIPSGRFGLIDNGNYSGYLQLQVKKSGAAANPLLTAMNIVPVPASSSLTTCVSFGKDEFNNVLFDLHKPEATLTTNDTSCRYSGSGTTYYVSGTNKFSPRLMVAVGDIVSFDNFSTEAVVTGVVSNSTTCQITTNVSLGSISSKQIYVKKAYLKITDESNNIKVYVNPYGKFGIGTATPSSDLDVNGTINASTDVKVNGSSVALASQIPTDTSDLTNGAGYITGITSSDVTTALGYTPYDSTNPSGYQENVIETIKVNGTAQTVTSKAVDITVPTVNNSTITITQGGVTKGSFTLNQSSGDTIELDAGSGGGAVDSVNGKTGVVVLDYSDVGALPDTTVIPTVDQTYSSTSSNAQSGTAVASAVSGKQATITGGATTITSSNLTTNRALISNASGKVAVSSVTSTELGYVSGVTSAIQTQLNGKVSGNTSITGATKCKITYDSKGLVTAGADLSATDIPSLSLSKITDVTATASELNVLDGITATTTELNYVDGVTSSIQTQLNGKVASNTAITGATKCKITYDSKGLVTAGADLSSSDITTALGYTPYSSANPAGYTSNVGTVTSVNNVSPVNGNVTLSIPSEVTETTVSNWGFTKNTGTVTSVNNVSPVSGNVTLSIPTDTNDLTNGAGYITSSALSGYATETWVGQQGYLQNTATGTGSLNILGTVTSNANSVSVGVSSNSGPSAVAVGYDSRADNGVAIGKSAKSTGNYSIQLGSGTNSENQSFYVSTHPDHNWKLLGSLGKIPNERLSILSYVVEYYDDADGYWYRLWSDDWLEQGFIGSPSGASPTFTFPKPFYDADYNLVLGAATLNQYWSAKTSTGFKFNSNAAGAKSWYACGWAGSS